MRTNDPWFQDLKAPGLVLALLLALVSFDAKAEVGITTSGENLSSIYILGTITDDPGPFGSVWAQYHPGSPGRHVLNPAGYQNGDGEPSILFDPSNGRAIVAWAKNSPAGFDIAFSRFVDGAWTAPAVLAGTSADERDPVLALDPSSGTVHLYYWVHDGSPRIMTRSAPVDQLTWGPVTQVSAPGTIAARPSAVYHEGLMQVAYEVHASGFGSTPREIVLATDDGAGYLDVLLATTYHSGANWPQVHSAVDRMWVEWIDADAEMAWTRRENGTSWGPLQPEPFTDAEERDYHVRGEIRLQAID